jgi:O-antigen/teichoic acid export membrane protein
MALAMKWFVRPEFRFDGLSKLIGFGGAVILNSLIWFFYAQADIFIAGRALPAAEVGLYSTALFLATLPVVKLIPVLNEVGFTAYSRIQHDPVAVKLNFLKAVRLVSLACFPIFVGLGATAEWFVPVVLGAQWLAAVPLLQLLALAMPLYALGHLMPPAVNALGQPRVQTVNALIGLAIMPAAFLVGVRYGPLGLATVWLAAYPLLFAITSARALRVIGASFADLGRAALPPLASALIMGGAVLGLAAVTDLPPVAELLLLITTGVAAYVAAVSLLFPALRAEALDLIRR